MGIEAYPPLIPKEPSEAYPTLYSRIAQNFDALCYSENQNYSDAVIELEYKRQFHNTDKPVYKRRDKWDNHQDKHNQEQYNHTDKHTELQEHYKLVPYIQEHPYNNQIENYIEDDAPYIQVYAVELDELQVYVVVLDEPDEQNPSAPQKKQNQQKPTK